MNYTNKNYKIFTSKDVNYIFNKSNGFMAVWGKSYNDDPNFSPYGPFLLDIEVTTICNGPGGIVCPFCYKNNTSNGINMPFSVFKIILDKMPETVTQIAFGADASATSNPYLFKMMEYTRSKGIIPNITVSDISDSTAKKLASLCGAVAVSRYSDYNICYNSVKKLIDAGLKQTNMHFMLSEETYDEAFKTIDDYFNDFRLKNLNAIVFLSLKQKGRGVRYNPINDDKFNKLINYAFEKKVPIGFDSCSAHKFLNSIKNRKDYNQLELLVEPCESSLFSAYINAEGKFFPCSFTEGCKNWEEGLDVVKCNDFLKDIWNHEKTVNFRNNLIKNKRMCPIYII